MVHVCFLRRSYLTSRCTQQRLFVAVPGKSIGTPSDICTAAAVHSRPFSSLYVCAVTSFQPSEHLSKKRSLLFTVYYYYYWCARFIFSCDGHWRVKPPAHEAGQIAHYIVVRTCFTCNNKYPWTEKWHSIYLLACLISWSRFPDPGIYCPYWRLCTTVYTTALIIDLFRNRKLHKSWQQ